MDNKILKTIRLKLGLTQKALGLKLQVTQGAVSHWERGTSYPSIMIAAKIAKLAEKKGMTYTSKALRDNQE